MASTQALQRPGQSRDPLPDGMINDLIRMTSFSPGVGKTPCDVLEATRYLYLEKKAKTLRPPDDDRADKFSQLSIEKLDRF